MCVCGEVVLDIVGIREAFLWDCSLVNVLVLY